jgi:Domain of unknown function (DUF5615)
VRLSGDIAAQLHGKGHDVIAVVEDSELVGLPDEDLLARASSAGRLLVTANVRDFAALHTSWSSGGRSHAGLIYIVNRVFPSDRSFVGAAVTAIDNLIEAKQLPADGAETDLHRRQP